MAYDKQTFSDGEVLTATKLNHMEGGIEAAHKANPPSCNFPAYSKVLSNGISGPEWVDISVQREFKGDALVDPTWFYELYDAYMQGLIAEIYCVDDTSTMTYLCVGSNVGELIFQRSEGDTVETLYLYADGVIIRSTNTAILYTPQTLSEEQKAQARLNISAAFIDNTKVGADAWSSKNTVDRLCPEFTQSGSVVSCQPVQGYPLEVLTEEGATKVTRCGKNFLPYPYSGGGSATYFGIKVTDNGDGSITFNGTATRAFYYFLRNDFTEATLPAGSYCISTAGRSAMSIQVEARKDGVYVKNVKVGDGSFTVNYSTYDTVRIFLLCDSGKTVNETIYPQLERGSSATAYEPSNVQTFAPGDAIPALPGVNTIYADAGLVTVTGKAYPVEGTAGQPGYTPQKGVDYYTEEDKAEMVNAVLAALPNGDEVAY